MTNKRKKLARALSEKTGMSHQAAVNSLAESAALRALPRVDRSLGLLMAELRVTSTFGVVTGRSPAVGRSAILALAVQQAEALATRPVYFAEASKVAPVVTASESRLLLDAGAAESGAIQVIRAFMIGEVHSVSEQCEQPDCRRWIWCFRHPGESSVQDTCYCGHRYRIVFDATLDWDRALDLRCMQCGTEHRMSQRHENLNPWRWVNGRQVLCNKCSTRADVSEGA